MARITRAPNRLATRQCTPRPPLHVLVVALCLASSYLPSASSQSAADSCSNGLSLGSLVPFNTTGLVCFQAWPSQDFILRVSAQRYLTHRPHTVLLLACSSARRRGTTCGASCCRHRTTAGTSRSGSRRPGGWWGASAVAGWATGAGAGSSAARQYYLGGTSSSSCPPDQGKLALVAAARPTVVSKGSRLYLAFQLAAAAHRRRLRRGPHRQLAGVQRLLPQHQDMASGTISLSGSGSGTGGGSPATARRYATQRFNPRANFFLGCHCDDRFSCLGRICR
ncbi:hypothetical protein HU200_011326 [Digitaria exilis]|uniref:Uncharacterized protein n=1 Tax=Digitaria exilis TaxID=1010633 RepID=A0A835FH53_9POAL|nr:hypothetical protein HU200_011326 [Digitaria exilis]